jgi:hypothetical protein
MNSDVVLTIQAMEYQQRDFYSLAYPTGIPQ